MRQDKSDGQGRDTIETHQGLALSANCERGIGPREGENHRGTADSPFDKIEEGGHQDRGSHHSSALSLLNIYVNTYEQAQKLRMETMNRMRCWLRDTVPKEEWSERKFSDDVLLTTTVLPNDLRDFACHLMQLESDAGKYVRREMAKHPLWPWLSSIRGIGPILSARLLHRIDGKTFPSPAHLWSYCGLDGPDWRQKPHNWGLTAICYNIAESFQRQPALSGGYRDIYDARKQYEATKPPCDKCREQGFEDSCRPGHINNKARRYTVKCFLKDLWVQMNEEEVSHDTRQA